MNEKALIEIQLLREQLEQMRIHNAIQRQQLDDMRPKCDQPQSVPDCCDSSPEIDDYYPCQDATCEDTSAALGLGQHLFNYVVSHPDFAEAVLDVIGYPVEEKSDCGKCSNG